jgi:hypothetical protein
MVKVSVIVSKEDKTSSPSGDIEIVDNIESSKADYVYFKNVNDNLYPEVLIEAYEKASEDGLDYVVLNSLGVDDEEIGIYKLDDFESDIFRTDFKITSKLIKKSIIKDSFDERPELLNFDVILSSDKFSFLQRTDYFR